MQTVVCYTSLHYYYQWQVSVITHPVVEQQYTSDHIILMVAVVHVWLMLPLATHVVSNLPDA